jgi:aspartate oxidase
VGIVGGGVTGLIIVILLAREVFKVKNKTKKKNENLN